MERIDFFQNPKNIYYYTLLTSSVYYFYYFYIFFLCFSQGWKHWSWTSGITAIYFYYSLVMHTLLTLFPFAFLILPLLFAFFPTLFLKLIGKSSSFIHLLQFCLIPTQTALAMLTHWNQAKTTTYTSPIRGRNAFKTSYFISLFYSVNVGLFYCWKLFTAPPEH